MILRKVSFKDYKKINSLFKRNKIKMISNKRWINLWKKNPAVKNKNFFLKGWALEEEKKIVGHIGTFPTKYTLKSKNYNCSNIHNWVVDEKHRYQSSILMKKTFNSKGNDFYLSTSTNKQAGNLMKALDSKQIPSDGLKSSLFVILNLKQVIYFILKKKNFFFKSLLVNISTYILKLFFGKKINHWIGKFSSKNIIKCKKIDKNFNYIWNDTKKIYSTVLLLNRDKKWLEWNLNYFIKKNKVWIFFSKENKKITGYAICIETKDSNNFKRAYLIDLILLKKSKEISINLIGSCIQEAKKRNCDIFEFRGFDKKTRVSMNFFSPFKKNLSHNPFYYKSNNNKLNKMIKEEKCWYPTYMDGDAIKGF